MPAPSPRRRFSLVHVTKPMAHHGEFAGYNRLVQHLPADLTVRAGGSSIGRLANTVGRRLMRSVTGSEWYGPASAWAELRAAAWVRARGATVVHVLYGEDLVRFLPRLAGPRAAVVATFHQPPERLEALVRDPAAWRALAGVIVLDEHNASRWEQRLPGRVHRLALGIDTAFWSPGTERRRRRVLFVGNHLRDFTTLGSLSAALQPFGIAVDAVVPARRAQQVRGFANTCVHVAIPDAALRDLYRGASVLCLPLLGASASNTVLQALACGLPVVATDVGGMRSYVDASTGRLVPPGDLGAFVAALTRLVDDPADASVRSRERALEHGWPHLAQLHRDCYATAFAEKFS